MALHGEFTEEVVGAEADFGVCEVHRVVGYPHVFAEGCWDGFFAMVEELAEDVVFLSPINTHPSKNDSERKGYSPPNTSSTNKLPDSCECYGRRKCSSRA